jgi:hypothetical protein
MRTARVFTRRDAFVTFTVTLGVGLLLGSQAVGASDAGDPLAASRRLRERAGSVAPLPLSGSGITRDVGAIAVVEHDGSNYDRLEGDGTPNYAARARVAQRFYADHGDRYDFLLVFTNFPFQTNGAIAFHGLVRNDVAGIGLPIAQGRHEDARVVLSAAATDVPSAEDEHAADDPNHTAG